MRSFTALLTCGLIMASGCRTANSGATVKDELADAPALGDQGEAASARTAVKCSSEDGSTTVNIVQLAGGTLRATLTTESTGDSQPSFKYTVTHKGPAVGVMGGGQNYTGGAFSLYINTDGVPDTSGGFHSRLTDKDVGLADESMGCTYSDSTAIPRPIFGMPLPRFHCQAAADCKGPLPRSQMACQSGQVGVPFSWSCSDGQCLMKGGGCKDSGDDSETSCKKASDCKLPLPQILFECKDHQNAVGFFWTCKKGACKMAGGCNFDNRPVMGMPIAPGQGSAPILGMPTAPDSGETAPVEGMPAHN